jgi:branched-chain amino acid transport system substrate-binding protein
MKIMNPKKVAFLLVNDDYGHSFADSFSRDLGKLGVQTVAKEPFERGNTDMVVYLNKVRDAGADLVMYVGTTPEGAMILKQARELGMIPKINFMGSDEMAEQEMVNLAGAKACEGTYSLATYGSVPMSSQRE